MEAGILNQSVSLCVSEKKQFLIASSVKVEKLLYKCSSFTIYIFSLLCKACAPIVRFFGEVESIQDVLLCIENETIVQ